VQREAEALSGAGFEVEVVCMRGATRERRTLINGVKVIRLPGGRPKASKLGKALAYGCFFLLATAYLSLQHLRRPYTVVQANSMPDFLVFSAVVPKLMGCRVIAKLQEPTPELAATIFGRTWLTGLLARIEQSAIRFADHTVTVTDQLKQRYVERGAPADRITVVLNCVDPGTLFENWSPALSKNRSEFVAICHGSIEDRYGQDTIIAAACLLRSEMPDLRFVITGRGSGAGTMRDSIAEHGLNGIVRFEGWVSQARLNDILHSADVGIVAQKASPYSHLVHTNKMMDYWIFGLPVIASRLDAVTGYYDDRVIEYFEPGDAAGLAAGIRRLRTDARRRKELIESGRCAQLRNGWATQRLSYLRVFDSVVTRTPRETQKLLSRIPESEADQWRGGVPDPCPGRGGAVDAPTAVRPAQARAGTLTPPGGNLPGQRVPDGAVPVEGLEQ
jgi:glycosyltransferase involved in cell wall biosynthesis